MQTVDFKHIELSDGDKLLDLGCGEGRHVIAAYLEKNIQAVGVDLGFNDLKITADKFSEFCQSENAEKSFGLSVANALSLPFEDNTFDVIICSEVLEHIPDYESVLTEIERIMVPGGTFIASVPRAWPERICWYFSGAYHQVEGGHLRIFDASQLRSQIEARGFYHYHRHWAHALHSPFWWLKCMFWDSQEESLLIQLYHKLLVWDLMQRPWLTRSLEALLNPIMGKSIVMYFNKPKTAS
jgi:SAM-dependent methyltransferase